MKKEGKKKEKKKRNCMFMAIQITEFLIENIMKLASSLLFIPIHGWKCHLNCWQVECPSSIELVINHT